MFWRCCQTDRNTSEKAGSLASAPSLSATYLKASNVSADIRGDERNAARAPVLSPRCSPWRSVRCTAEVAERVCCTSGSSAEIRRLGTCIGTRANSRIRHANGAGCATSGPVSRSKVLKHSSQYSLATASLIFSKVQECSRFFQAILIFTQKIKISSSRPFLARPFLLRRPN